MKPCNDVSPNARPRALQRRSPSPGAWLSPLAFAILVACALVVSCGKKEDSPPVPAPPEPKGTNAAGPAAVRPEFAKLAGKWERPDGGYVLEIKGVDAAGTMQAAYFNPNPINVSQAAALYKDGATKVFVELRDANYPGCTYSLTYDPQSDQLYGQYFQASMQQTFDVTFARMK
jgi:hypothetical protein